MVDLMFSRAFWHPFGAHGDEGPDEILARKRGEVERNGWTLWSFQHRRPEVLAAWHRDLATVGGRSIAICSDSPSARSPSGQVEYCSHFKLVDHDAWVPMPAGITVPHPFRATRRNASAFVVNRIIYPIDVGDLPAVEWLLSDGAWRRDRLPTHGEYLLRRGGASPIRKPLAVLELRAPFLATVGFGPAPNA